MYGFALKSAGEISENRSAEGGSISFEDLNRPHRPRQVLAFLGIALYGGHISLWKLRA